MVEGHCWKYFPKYRALLVFYHEQGSFRAQNDVGCPIPGKMFVDPASIQMGHWSICSTMKIVQHSRSWYHAAYNNESTRGEISAVYQYQRMFALYVTVRLHCRFVFNKQAVVPPKGRTLMDDTYEMRVPGRTLTALPDRPYCSLRVDRSQVVFFFSQ